MAGFGLGTLGLALILPAPIVPPLPLPPEGRFSPASAAPPMAREWPAAFGTPPPVAPPAIAEPVAFEDDGFEPFEDDDGDYLPYTDHDYRLRGMVAHMGDGEQGGGWALIESSIGIEVVRTGSELSGGESIVEITPHGVILQGYGAEFLLSFAHDDYGDSSYGDDDGGPGPYDDDPG